MSLKDKLTQMRDYVAMPRRDEPSAGSAPAPTLSASPEADDFEDEDRTIYEHDPATLEQIRSITAGWNPAPGAQPAPPPTPAEPPRAVETPARAGRVPNQEDIRVDLNNFSPLRADGSIDFNAVYSRAGLRAPAFGAEQMLQMISELPSEMPAEMKRQTVQVMVNTMGRHLGATSEAIGQDASRKVAALAAFVTEYEKKLKETTAGVEAEIASLQALIEEKNRTLQGTTDRLNQVQAQCEGESERLDDVMGYLTVAAPAEKVPLSAARAADAPSSPDNTNSWESAPSVEVQSRQAEEAESDTADTVER